MQRFEKIDIITIPASELEAVRIEIRDTEGKTPVKELRSRHVDLLHIDLGRLVKLAQTLAPRIRSNDSVFPFTRMKLIRLVHDAVSNDRVSIHDLDETLRLQLGDYQVEIGQFVEAEPLILESYETVQCKSARQTNKALRRIVNFYESWNDAESGKGYGAKAAEWRTKLPKESETKKP